MSPRPLVFIPGLSHDEYMVFTAGELQVLDDILGQLLARAQFQRVPGLALELSRTRYRLAAVALKMFPPPGGSDGAR